MKTVTRYAALNRMLTCLGWGLNFEIKPNSLITEVLADPAYVPGVPAPATRGMYVPGSYNPALDTRQLKIGVLMVGRGGHGYELDDDNEVSPITYPHKSSDTGLFQPIPLIVREVNNDLTGTMKALYRLRTISQINGIYYAFYFGKKLDVTEIELQQILETINDGVVVNTEPYEPTANDLRPEKTDISVISDGTSLRTYAGLVIGFDDEEVVEMQNACELLLGDRNKAVVSEIAYVFGVDKPVTGVYPTTGTQTPQIPPANTYEFSAPHIGIVESTYKPVEFVGAFQDTKNIGIAEPLFGIR